MKVIKINDLKKVLCRTPSIAAGAKRAGFRTLIGS
jgi:hypothetical protein